VDSAGSLYIADTGSQRIRKVSQGVITTVAGDAVPFTDHGMVVEFPPGFSGDGGPATSALLAQPNGVAVDSAGNLYIVDSLNQRIREVSGGVINTVVGNGTSGFIGDNGPATSAELAFPQGVAVDSAANLYIADTGSFRIRKVSSGVITTAMGWGTDLGDNGLATGPNAQLNAPNGLAVDSAGEVYIADGFNRIRKVSSGVITTVAGSGTPLFGGYSGDGGPATSAQLAGPTGVAVDSAGNLYIADTENNRIRKVSSGVITTVAGNGTQSFSGDGGPATSAGLNSPGDVAADSAGNLYIADSGNRRIRKVSNGVITTVAGNGTNGFSGDGGPATSAQLINPGSIAVDSAGNLYIVGGNRIREVSNGVITTVAGNGNTGFSGDSGPATSAPLNAGGVAVDSAGSLYITDEGNYRVRKVSGGVITTIAGNGTQGFSGDGGPATSAELASPGVIAVDSAGYAYFSDNNLVRLLTPSGSSCSASASPVNFTPAAAGGNLSVTIQTTGSCAWAVQGLPSWITYSGNAIGSGPATITLSVAANTSPARSAIISVAGTLITVAQAIGPGVPPPPSVSLTQSAGQFGAFSSIAPGTWIEIYGSNLAPSILDWSNAFSGINAPTSLNGTTVAIAGELAFLDYVSPTQVNAQVPSNVSIGQQQVIVATAGGSSAPYNITVTATQPGLWAPQFLDISGTQYVGATFPDYATYVLPTNAVAGITSRPASPGATIYLFGVGFGPVTPNIPAGQIVEQENTLNSTMQVMFGQTPATLTYAGLAPNFIGLYLFKVTVPNVPTNNAVPLTFTQGGSSGTQTLYIAVQD
jgi:trimeric autotransporter adhesin